MKNGSYIRKISRFVTAFCLSFCLLFSVLSTPACADEEAYPIDHRSPYYQKLEEFGGAYTDVFTQFLYGEILAGKTEISIPTSIRFPVYYTDYSSGQEGEQRSTVQFVYDWIFYDCPALFHISMGGFRYSWARTSGGMTCVARAEVVYDDTVASHEEKLRACDDSAASILKGIEGNNNLSDTEKALLIHDRLAVFCAYAEEGLLNDTLTHEEYTMYGVFVNRSAVCQGYALAYKYLLARVGIFSYVCASDDINHAWNIVYIDGSPYHVDVTHDDPVNNVPPYDEPGRVYHDHFLLTDAEYQAAQQEAFGVDSFSYTFSLPQIPTDTRYQDAYWRDLIMEVVLIDDELYYCGVDEYYSDECAVLKTASGDIVEEFYYDCYLREVNGTEVEFWEDYPMPDSLRCGAYMGYFLYSQPDGIYGYHLETKTIRKFFGNPVANGTHEEDYFYVFGCSDGKVSYDVYRTNLEYIPSTGNYRYTTLIVSNATVTVTLFDVNKDNSLDILDLVKAKKMLANNQRRFIDGCGQIGSADSLVLIKQALMAS